MTPSATVNPKVTLAGVTYELKFGVLAELKMSEMGIDPQVLFEDARNQRKRLFADYLKLFSAMVAHHFLRLHQAIPTPEAWAITLEEITDREDRTSTVTAICDAVVKTLYPNLSAAAQKLREPATAQEPTPPLTN